MLFSGATKAVLDGTLATRSLGGVEVKGRLGKVEVYTLADWAGRAVDGLPPAA